MGFDKENVKKCNHLKYKDMVDYCALLHFDLIKGGTIYPISCMTLIIREIEMCDF